MSFKLHVKTLAGNQYTLMVSPTQSIAIVKRILLNKLIHDPFYSISLDPETTTLRLMYDMKNEPVELMNDKKISDYSLNASSNVAVVIDPGKGRFNINVLAPHGMFILRVKPTDTIHDVKKQIYDVMLEEPFYEDKSSSSGVFDLRIQQDGTSIKLLPLRTVESYPGITSHSTIEVVTDDEELFVEICKHVSEYVDDCYGSIAYNYLESVDEFKQRIIDKFDIPADFQLGIDLGKKGMNILEEGTHLYDYDMSKVSILLIIDSENSNYGGKRKPHSKKRRTKRSTKRSTKRNTKRSTKCSNQRKTMRKRHTRKFK